MSLPDVDDLDTFGGVRANFQPITDPSTDVGAEHWNPLSCDVAMMTQTAIRAWVTFTGLTYSSGTQAIPVDSHGAVWGSGTGVRPVVSQTSAGVLFITWPTSVTDLLLESHPVNIRMPMQPMVFGADGLMAKVVGFSANVISLNTFSGGAANALNGTKIGVSFL